MQTSGFTIITSNVLTQIIASLHERFVNEYELNEAARLAIVAAVSNPEYKLRWAFDEEVETKARKMFSEEVQKAAQQSESSQSSATQKSSTSSLLSSAAVSPEEPNNSDFIILRPITFTSNNDQALAYLDDRRDDIKHLACYPIVSKVFKRSNTPLCSSV